MTMTITFVNDNDKDDRFSWGVQILHRPILEIRYVYFSTAAVIICFVSSQVAGSIVSKCSICNLLS